MNITQEDVYKWMRDNPDLAAANTTAPAAELSKHLPVSTNNSKNILQNIPSESETDFQQRVIKLLQENKWRVLVTGSARIRKGGKDTYVTPYRADGKGFPDILAVKDGIMIALELKSSKGKLSIEQTEWLIALSLCGVQVGVMTPEDWPEIEKIVQEGK